MSSRPPSLSKAVPGLRRIIGRMTLYLRGHCAMMGGSLVALLAATGFKLLEPWPLKFVIDRIFPTATGGAPGAAGLEVMTLLALCALALVAVTGLWALLEHLATIGFALVGNRVLTQVRSDLFRRLQALPLSFHTRARTGDLTPRLIGDVGMLEETIVTAGLPLLASVLVLAGMIGVMLWLNWRLTLLALAPLPLLWIVSLRLTRQIGEVSRTQRKREGHLAATASEAMAGIRAVQALGLEERLGQRFAVAGDKDLTTGVKGKRLSAALDRSVDVLTEIGLAVVLWFGTLQVLRGRLSPGDLLVFITYLKNTFRPVREYAKYTSRLVKASAAGERIATLIDEEATVRDAPDARPAPAFRGDIALGAGREVARAEIEAAARLASAHDFITAQPQGYDTPAAERGATLSPGQRQRLTIARVALRDCPILVLDEPTVGLGRVNETAVMAAIGRLTDGRTNLTVTHDLNLAARMDLVVYLNDGRVAEAGTHAELLRRGGYARLWEASNVVSLNGGGHALAR